jgi:hypothetical protein
MGAARRPPFADILAERTADGDQPHADEALPFRTLADLIASVDDGLPERWIVKHYVAPGAKTCCSSLPKAGKSTMGFGMVRSIRRTEEFAGLPTAPNVGVLYLTEETSVRALEVKAAAIDLDITDPGVLFLRRVDVFGKPWPEIVEEVRARATAFKASGGFDDVLIVVDTLGKWAGFKEGQEQDAGATRDAIERLDPLAGDGHAVLIFTHAGWGAKRSRGSSAIPGEVDIVLFLDGDPGSNQPRSILYEGGRLDDGETPRSWSLALGDDGLTSFGEVGTRRAVKLVHVLEAVQQAVEITSVKLAEIIGVTDRTARRYLNQLVASGELIRQDQIGGAGGGSETVYSCATSGRTEGPGSPPNGQRATVRPLPNRSNPLTSGPPLRPAPKRAAGQHMDTPLSVRPPISGRADKGPGGPEGPEGWPEPSPEEYAEVLQGATPPDDDGDEEPDTEPAPGSWQALQRDAGETPPATDEEAFAALVAAFPEGPIEEAG